MIYTTVKDAGATLDFAIDWGTWLVSGDSIATSTWTITGPDSALTIVSTAIMASNAKGTANAQAVAWLSGGTLGNVYRATNKITTSSTPTARIDERSIQVTIVQL